MQTLAGLVGRWFGRSKPASPPIDTHAVPPSRPPAPESTPADSPSQAEATPKRDLCTNTLELLAALLLAKQVVLWSPVDAARPARTLSQDDRFSPPAFPPACPAEPRYSPDGLTLLLPCPDPTGRPVALVLATGRHVLRCIPVGELAMFAGVLAHTVALPDFASQTPAETRS